MAGYYDHKGMWYPPHQGPQQQQMYTLPPTPSMPINPPQFHQHIYRIPLGSRGGFVPPFSHRSHTPHYLIRPTQHEHHQARFHQHQNPPPQPFLEPHENQSEHQSQPVNLETHMGEAQSTKLNSTIQDCASPFVLSRDYQTPSNGETWQHNVTKPPPPPQPLMQININQVIPEKNIDEVQYTPVNNSFDLKNQQATSPHYNQGSRILQPQENYNTGQEHTVKNKNMSPHQSYRGDHVTPAPHHYQQPSHGENFQHIDNIPGEQLPPRHYKQQRNKKHYNQPTDGDNVADSNLQQSAHGVDFQPGMGPQQHHKQHRKKKHHKKPWFDGGSAEPSENWDYNPDSNQQQSANDNNFQYNRPPWHQRSHRPEEKGYNQAWGGPVPYQDSNQYQHRGRGRGYRGRYPRNKNYNYNTQNKFGDHTPRDKFHKDDGNNQQKESSSRNSDLLQEQAEFESPAMVAAVSTENVPVENSVNDIIISASPEDESVIVEAQEKNQVITQLPEEEDLSYINTMNLAELQRFCSDICSESKDFWGPLEQMPQMLKKIELVIEMLPQKCNDQSKIDVLVQDMQRCLSLLESRAPMIESAGNEDYGSSDSEVDEMYQKISNIGMDAIGLYTKVRLNPVPQEEVEINILQQRITKCQTDLDQLPIAEDDEILIENVRNILVLCNDAQDLLLHRANIAVSELYSSHT